MSEISPVEQLRRMPEAFVSHKGISRAVHRAVKAGAVRKLASRLYTKDMESSPETLVKRNLWEIVAGFFPEALIADRTALENAPAKDGSVCLITSGGRALELPGITLRPRRGVPPLSSDRPFVASLFLSSTARAYIENMRPSRARGNRLPRTVGRTEVEARFERLLQRSGEIAINRLRDEIRRIGAALEMEDEAAQLDEIAGALLGTRKARLSAPTARARQRGEPYDPDRLELFQKLHAALRGAPLTVRTAPKRSTSARTSLAFFEAYFSNFIEGTEFDVQEAADIVFRGVIPPQRPEDAHDILGTYRITADINEMNRVAREAREYLEMQRARHAIIMGGRPDKRPGELKSHSNRAGGTVFVAPDLVEGTFRLGFDIMRSLELAFHRAVFAMFLVSEVHPFADGNGRTARIAMNAELEADGEERIIIPTVYRSNYLSALKAMSQTGRPEPMIRMLEHAQAWVSSVPWGDLKTTQSALHSTNAFLSSAEAEQRGLRLKLFSTKP